MLESELGLLFLAAGKVAEAKEMVEKGKTAVDDLQVGTVLHSYLVGFGRCIFTFLQV